MASLLETIKQQRRSFSKGQKQVADYVTKHYADAAFMTASKLGQTAGVSESTVLRFVYSLGLGGYPDLQEALQNMMRSELNSVQRLKLVADIPVQNVFRKTLSDDIENLTDTLEKVETETYLQVVSAILNARTLYLIGSNRTTPLTEYFAYYMKHMLGDVRVVNSMEQGMVEHLVNVGEEDVCFAISFSRYSKRTMDAARYAKEHGAKILVLTDSDTAPITEIADYSLTAGCSVVSLANSVAAPMSVLNAIINSVAIEKNEGLTEHLEKMETIWEAEGVYETGRRN